VVSGLFPHRSVLTVHGHLVDLGRVVLLDIPQDPDVVVLDEVDRNTLAAEPTRATDPEG
jgi:hypothetical protein